MSALGFVFRDLLALAPAETRANFERRWRSALADYTSAVIRTAAPNGDERALPDHGRIRVGELILDIRTRTATLDGHPLTDIERGPILFSLLVALALDPERVYTVRELVGLVTLSRDGSAKIDGQRIRTTIGRVRRALGNGWIVNRHGFGYSLLPPGGLARVASATVSFESLRGRLVTKVGHGENVEEARLHAREQVESDFPDDVWREASVSTVASILDDLSRQPERA